MIIDLDVNTAAIIEILVSRINELGSMVDPMGNDDIYIKPVSDCHESEIREARRVTEGN